MEVAGARRGRTSACAGGPLEPALALEQMGKKGEFADAADRLAVLDSEMSRLFPALREFIGREKC